MLAVVRSSILVPEHKLEELAVVKVKLDGFPVEAVPLLLVALLVVVVVVAGVRKPKQTLRLNLDRNANLGSALAVDVVVVVVAVVVPTDHVVGRAATSPHHRARHVERPRDEHTLVVLVQMNLEPEGRAWS